MRTLWLLILTALFAIPSMMAVDYGAIRFHDQDRDTVRINALLSEAAGQRFPDSGQCIAWLAGQFIGTPYGAGTLETSPGEAEVLTVNLDSLDCTTLAETALALAYTVGEGRTSWRDFAYNLERLRYRHGQMDGYGSRLHYMSDWIMDNASRGNVQDVTATFPKVGYEVKDLDYMSRHRDAYPQLMADSAALERVRSAEVGFRRHRFPIIKAHDLTDRATLDGLHDGDMVVLLTKTPGLDASHVGIIVRQPLTDGSGSAPRLLHASSAAGKVEVSPLALAQYFHRNRHLTGLRVVRLKDW